jgi:nickel transport protein
MRNWAVKRGLALALAALVCLAAAPAAAHRVNVFAYVEGDMVHVECSYSRSDRVRFGEIIVKDAATGQVFLTGKTDEKGNFAFAVPQDVRKAKADLAIELKAGEGHQNETTVKADEYLAAPPAATSAAPAATPAPAAAVTPAATSAPAAASTTAVPAAAPAAAAMDPAALRAVVEQAVEVKIAPIRKMLVDEKEKGPGLAEIAGGIGWLVGIAGLLAYVRCRRSGPGA